MANDLLDKMPAWLKSLWDMDEPRSAAWNCLILRKDEPQHTLQRHARGEEN